MMLRNCVLLLALAHIAIGENHLLVDKLRLDFIDIEDKLWKFVLWEAPTVDKTNAEFHVINRFSEFDQAMKQVNPTLITKHF